MGERGGRERERERERDECGSPWLGPDNKLQIKDSRSERMRNHSFLKTQGLGNTSVTSLFSVRMAGAVPSSEGHNHSEPDLGQDRSPKTVRNPMVPFRIECYVSVRLLDYTICLHYALTCGVLQVGVGVHVEVLAYRVAYRVGGLRPGHSRRCDVASGHALVIFYSCAARIRVHHLCGAFSPIHYVQHLQNVCIVCVGTRQGDDKHDGDGHDDVADV